MMRASFFRFPPILLLAAALLALAVVPSGAAAHHGGTTPAANDPSVVWAATLTGGSTLSDNSFTRGDVDFRVTGVRGGNAPMLRLDRHPGQVGGFTPDEHFEVASTAYHGHIRSRLFFWYDDEAFAFRDARMSWGGGNPTGDYGAYTLHWDRPDTSRRTTGAVPVRLALAPAEPTAVTTTPRNGGLTISWTAPAGPVTGYDVQYKAASASAWTGAGRATTASRVIRGLTNAAVYEVRVRARNNGGWSRWAHNGAWEADYTPTGNDNTAAANRQATIGCADWYAMGPLYIAARPGKEAERMPQSFCEPERRVRYEINNIEQSATNPGALSNNTFTVAGETYTVVQVEQGSSNADQDATGNQDIVIRVSPQLSAEAKTTMTFEGWRLSIDVFDESYGWGGPDPGRTYSGGNYQSAHHFDIDNDAVTVSGDDFVHGNSGAAIATSKLAWLVANAYPVFRVGDRVRLRMWSTGLATPDANRPASPPQQGPTAVSLALDQDRVNEDAGQVMLTATLDRPAPAGGLDLRLYAANESTATKGVDYTLPASIAIPYGGLSASTRIRITDDALDESDETAVIGVIADTLDATLTASITLTIVDDDGTPQQQQATTQTNYADLIAQMYGWRKDWDRALLALGETVADSTLTPMTAAEAQALADQSWGARWVPVAKALWEIENRAPTVASAIADATIVKETGTHQVSLSGVFSDADNDALTVTAASGDTGVATVTVAADYSSLTVTAQSRGTATITVTAADGKAGTVADAFTVTVKAAPTVALAPSDLSGLEVGATRDVSLSGVFSDADGDALTVTASSSDETKATVSVAAGYSSVTVTAVAEGTATITVTAQDADGNTVSHEFDVAVTPAPQQQQVVDPNNQAPTVASAIADATIVNETGTHQVSLSGVFSDADNDSLTITAAASDTAKATVSVAADQSSLTVTAKARGTATITVTAKDGRDGSVSDAFTVKVKTAPAVSSALADLSLAEFETKDISLEGVFSDADGDALDATASSSNDFVAAAFAIRDLLTVMGVSAGTATVTVTAQDPDGNTVSDTFDVTVGAPQQDPPANQAPTVSSAIADATIVNESGTHRVSLSGVFSDADNDSLTISAGSSNEAAATVSVAAGYASLTVSAQARGTAAITVTADDGNGGTVEDVFTVTVKAAPVVASALADVSGLETGATREVSLSGVFSDADGDSLTVTAGSSANAIATVAVAAGGSRLTLTGVAEGTANITVTAQDSDGNRVSDTFAVSVVKAPEPDEPEPDSPTGAPTVASPLPDISLEGPEYREFDLSGVFSDPDGDDLTFSAVSSKYNVATMWLEGSTLKVVGTGTGTATITVTAEDPDGNTVSDAFEVSVRPLSSEG